MAKKLSSKITSDNNKINKRQQAQNPARAGCHVILLLLLHLYT